MMMTSMETSTSFRVSLSLSLCVCVCVFPSPSLVFLCEPVSVMENEKGCLSTTIHEKHKRRAWEKLPQGHVGAACRPRDMEQSEA